MIWESAYWKDDLLKQGAELSRRRMQRRWTDRSLARLEQSVMLGFYSIRKLIEAKKLTDFVVTTDIPVLTYLPKGKPITLLNWHHIDRLYYLEEAKRESIGLIDLCNQFVHSYIFAPLFDEAGFLSAIYVASDRLREKKLLEVAVERLVWLFDLVGNDEPAGGAMVYNPERRDYEVILCNPIRRGSSYLGSTRAKAANQGPEADG